MEVADRTAADRKGGHLARRAPTAASCCARPPRRPTRTSTPSRTSSATAYFNTNNLWFDLRALRDVLDARDGVLGLPMIVNRKTVDPSDQSSPEVIQIETAMGAAIEVFEGARGAARAADALRAGQDHQRPARRCAPTSTCCGRRPRGRARARRDDAPPFVDLDAEYYKLRRRLRRALPRRARRRSSPATRSGRGRRDASARGVVVRGDVTVEGPAHGAGRRRARRRVGPGSAHVRVAIGALVLTVGLGQRAHEEVRERDAHHDRLLGGHDRAGQRLVVAGVSPHTCGWCS